ncbi:hypothetical protein [Streptomyces sp. NPDC018352]|uniref:hypothetical protein n=1 Tax=Streptomyces sp. NPDC018352 TaxID=3157194 RepID=UPI0033DB1B01
MDFEPAAEGFAFEAAQELTVEYEPAEDVPRFFAATAAGIEEQLSLPEHGVVIATRVVLWRARADEFGSHELAFKIAGILPLAKLWRAGRRDSELCSSRRRVAQSHQPWLSEPDDVQYVEASGQAVNQ